MYFTFMRLFAVSSIFFSILNEHENNSKLNYSEVKKSNHDHPGQKYFQYKISNFLKQKQQMTIFKLRREILNLFI